MRAVDAFFRNLIERRYYAATRSGSLYPVSGPNSQARQLRSLALMTTRIVVNAHSIHVERWAGSPPPAPAACTCLPPCVTGAPKTATCSRQLLACVCTPGGAWHEETAKQRQNFFVSPVDFARTQLRFSLLVCRRRQVG